MTEILQPVGFGLNAADIRRFVIHIADNSWEKEKFPTNVPDFVCFSCNAESE
jgi:hypothetical protein